jgi:uracil phosphoribosyltransferase
MLFNLGENNSLANQFLLELRDKHIQQDRFRFRKNLERLGEIMAYEISKKLNYVSHRVETPLGYSNLSVPDLPVLIPVLRAGLPYFNGFQNFFDGADSGCVGAYRKESGEEIKINLDYVASPRLNERILILIDPMLATGKSLVRSVNELAKWGTPSHIHFATLVAAPEGIAFLKAEIKSAFSIWTYAVDEKLNDQFYIVPGLGDAGDLSFGEKL